MEQHEKVQALQNFTIASMHKTNSATDWRCLWDLSSQICFCVCCRFRRI